MVWFKIDDGFWSHPKVLELSPEAGWLWSRAGSYCAHQLTDGKVTPGTLRMLVATRDAATELVLAGLWDIDSDGAWWFHDWAEYQPTRDEVLKERAAATERKRASREKSRGSHGVTPPVTTTVSHSPPTRPDPTPSSKELGGSSPFCRYHPDGSDKPCKGCANARLKYEATNKAEKSKPSPAVIRPATCKVHAEYPLPCTRCRDDRESA